MIYFEIKRENGDIVASNIRKCPYFDLFQKERNLTLRSKQLKSAVKKYGSISIWLIVESEENLLRSNRLFNKMMDLHAMLVHNFSEYYFSKIRVHSHTLRTIQGKMKQKIDGLAAKKDFQGKDYSESKKNIIKKVELNIEKTADTICFLNKRVAEIDAHIGGFDVLYMGDEQDINAESVNIKKVLLNIIAPFLGDFEKQGVSINFAIKDDYADANKISLDYKMFNLALCNFFDNAIKYSKPYSEINITFLKKDHSFIVEVSMMSLRMDQDELDLIFDEGYSGKYASYDAGDGIGMSVMKKALNLTNMKIKIEPNYSESEIIGGRKYVRNIFKIISI